LELLPETIEKISSTEVNESCDEESNSYLHKSGITQRQQSDYEQEIPYRLAIRQL
jgi:hypothetical protein